mgnify:CR=1 FL=1
MINSFVQKSTNVILLIKGPSDSFAGAIHCAAAHAVVVRCRRFMSIGWRLAGGASMLLGDAAPVRPTIVLFLVVEFGPRGFPLDS